MRINLRRKSGCGCGEGLEPMEDRPAMTSGPIVKIRAVGPEKKDDTSCCAGADESGCCGGGAEGCCG